MVAYLHSKKLLKMHLTPTGPEVLQIMQKGMEAALDGNIKAKELISFRGIDKNTVKVPKIFICLIS